MGKSTTTPAAATAPAPTIEPIEPKFHADFKAAYRAGKAQAFILHLNIRDYVMPGVRLTKYLTQTLANRDIIVIYNISEGITFALPSMREKFDAALGLDEQQAADPALAVLGLGGGGNGKPRALPTSPAEALPLLERLLRTDVLNDKPLHSAVILEAAEKICPAADVAAMSPSDRIAAATLERWGIDKQIEVSGGLIFLLTTNLSALHQDLRSASNGYMALEVPLPAHADRLTFINWYIAGNEVKGMEMDAAQLANATAGLSLVHIENIFLSAKLEGKLTQQLARKEKAQIIDTEYAGLLEMFDPAGGFEVVGGMEPLKAWARREIIAPVREGRINDVPKGVLLAGAPGTGKSFFVKALARECGFNSGGLNFENILGGIVGTSERNLSRVFSVIKSLAPFLCFLDEIDQSDVSARGNASGNPVAKNLFSMLLRFMADPEIRGRVIFVMASNRPDLIDPALLRFGRVDAIVPFFLPELAERGPIACVTAAAQSASFEDAALGYLATHTEKYSGADIEALVTKARKVAAGSGRKTIGLADAERAVKTIRPATAKNADWYTMLAVDACNDTDLLPEKYARMLDNRDKLKTDIAQNAPAEVKARGRREL